MDTLEFLRAVLPDEGIFYLALIDRKTGRVAHKPFVSLEDMAAAVAVYDDGEQFSVYHACAAYKQRVVDVEVDGKTKKRFRVPDNWKAAKAFWIDLDCGEEKAAKGDGYVDKREAAKAVYKFCQSYDFPKPMVVDSGNGVHCYWPLTKAIPPTAWRKMANAFKVVLGKAGVLADPTCTADFARILRPAGSLNKKNTLKPVTVKTTVDPIEPQLIADRLKALVAELGVLPEPVRVATAPDINDDLTAHAPPSIPAFAEVAARQCNQLAEMRDSQGDVGYEHWRGVIGVIHHCEEGIELAREWSLRRAETGHAQVDVETKYNTWTAGPTTCEFFSKNNPDGCAGCMHKGKITSPIMLGRVIPEPQIETVEAIEGDQLIEVQVPALPRGYKYENGQIARLMQDKDGITHAFVFCSDLFYGTNRVRKEDGTYSMGIRVHLPNKRTREFQIDSGVIGDSATRVCRSLGEFEVMQTNNKDAAMHLHAYMRDWLHKLKSEVDEINTMTSFGWQEDQSFLLGERLYHRDGTMRKVLLGGMAADKAHCFPVPKGTVEGYAHGLNAIYAREHMEPVQYILASGFGCVLTPFADPQYHGLMLAVTSGESGMGKSTACELAMAAFGNFEEMQVKGEKGATTNARYSLLAAFKNLPLLLDELTQTQPEQLSELSYQISMGREKERLQIRNSAVRFANSQSWELSPFATANNSVHGKLAALNANSQAEAVRVIEINMDQHPKTKLTHEEFEPMRRVVLLNQGAAGEAYIRYVVANLAEVLDVMSAIGKKIHEAVPETKFRFYRYHAMCSLAALHVTNKLGITCFDEEAVFKYAVSLFKQLAESVSQNNSLTPEDAISAMLSDLSPRIVTTYEYRAIGDARGPEIPTKRINGTPAGRYIIGSPNTKTPELDGKLFIVRKEAADWCMKNRMGLKELLDYAQKIGVLVPYKQKFTIGRGTDVKTGNTTVICIDQNKLEQMVGNDLKLTIHTGGKAGISEAAAVS